MHTRFHESLLQQSEVGILVAVLERQRENRQPAQDHTGKNSNSGLLIIKRGLFPPPLNSLQHVSYTSALWVLFSRIAFLPIFSSHFNM